ncbi:alkyl hydroperoxide reductase [Pseudomonas aeruginosa]|nr:alkyl hydroperoxide reductase [Pseudomonas aeruginosa]
MSVDQGHQSFISQLNGVFQIDWENLNGVRQKCPIDLGHQ